VPIAAVLTPQQQAARALEAGSEAYVARDYGRAVASFEQALNLDPNLSDAHRSLGIVHADLHDETEAIAHYQKYLEMAPQAKDAARVKKIIDDYHLAHAPPPPPPPPSVKEARPHRGTGRGHRRPKAVEP
jgi:tetratricopeptide (TPR) repeat protein